MNRVVHIVSGRIDSGSQIGRFDGRMVGVAPFADELHWWEVLMCSAYGGPRSPTYYCTSAITFIGCPLRALCAVRNGSHDRFVVLVHHHTCRNVRPAGSLHHQPGVRPLPHLIPVIIIGWSAASQQWRLHDCILQPFGTGRCG